MHVTGARCPQDVLVPPPSARRWLYHSLRMEWSPKRFLLRYVPVFGICLRLPPITWAVLLDLLEPFPAFISLLSDDTPLLSSRLGDSGSLTKYSSVLLWLARVSSFRFDSAHSTPSIHESSSRRIVNKQSNLSPTTKVEVFQHSTINVAIFHYSFPIFVLP